MFYEQHINEQFEVLLFKISFYLYWLGCYTSLISIEIPSSLKTIDRLVFAGCTSLTSVEIPNGVTKIGEGAFSGCISLSSIDIPSSVTSIEEGAFSGCTGIKKFVVDKDNPNYCSLDGALYTKDMKILIRVPGDIDSFLFHNSVIRVY